MIEHEVELTVEPLRTDVLGDRAVVLVVAGVVAVAPAHGRLAHQEVSRPRVLELLADLGGEVARRDLLDVLHRVDAQAVEVVGVEPIDGVVDELRVRRGDRVVDVRHVRREHAVERVGGPIAAVGPAHAAGAEPIGVLGHVLVLLVHVVDDVVLQDANAVLVGLLDEREERVFTAEARVDLAGLGRPVAVVPGDLVHAVAREEGLLRVGLERREPDGPHAELVQQPLVDRLAQPVEIPAHPVSAGVRAGGRGRVVARVAIAITVGHHHVDERAVPIEGLGLDPEHQARGLTRGRAVRVGRHVEVVLAVVEAREVDRDRAVRRDGEFAGRQRRRGRAAAQLRREPAGRGAQAVRRRHVGERRLERPGPAARPLRGR